MNPRTELLRRAAVVGAHTIKDRLTRPVARTRDDVPVSGATITSGWLTDVLCRDVPGAEVVSFHTPGGSSGTSERLALRVEYNARGREAGLPTELFTKATTSFRQRLVLGGAGALWGESSFIRIRDRVEIEAPRGYWGRVDPDSWRSISIMEDVAATKGARFLEPTTGFTEEGIRDLVENLARLHGALWRAPDIGDLKTPADYLATTKRLLDIRKRCEVGMERAKAVIPSALVGQADRLFRATEVAMDIATDDMPRTFLHGDAHAGQTYATADGTMGLGDWQAVLQGGWSFDVAYLVNSGCEPEDRRAWQEGLIEAYCDQLARAGGPKLAFDDAFLAYRQQAFWPYTAWAFTIGRAAYQPEMQPVPTCLAIIRRTASAIDDLDSFTAVGL